MEAASPFIDPEINHEIVDFALGELNFFDCKRRSVQVHNFESSVFPNI